METTDANYHLLEETKVSPAEKPARSHRLMFVAGICITTILCGGIIVAILHAMGKLIPKHSINDYVLPNAQVTVAQDNTTFMSGSFSITNKTTAKTTNFLFQSDVATMSLQFVAQNPQSLVGVSTFKGFEVSNGSASSPELLLTLLETVGGSRKVVDVGSGSINNTGMLSFHTFANSMVVGYFVDLSAKLGALGWTGNQSHPAKVIHFFAHTFSQAATNPDWKLGNDTIFRTNRVVSAQQALGHQPTSVEEMNSALKSNGRRLIGAGCTMQNRCKNPCYGKCGPNCTCWKWVCGTCQCQLACQMHDYYCSCRGLWHWKCWGFAWVFKYC